MSHCRGLSTRHLALALGLALILSLLAPLAMPRAAYAQAGTLATITTPKLNVRSGPGAGFPVVTTVVQGETVTLLGRNADSSWAMVRTTGGMEGWSSTFYLTTATTWSSLPIVGGGTTVEPTAFVTTGALNVRTGPDPAYPVMMVLGQGQVMSMLGRNGNGTWVQVRVNGNIGWVDATFITASAPILNLPVTSGSVPPPGPPPATPPAPGTPTPMPGTPTPTPAPPPSGPGTAVVTTSHLNVRSGPGPGFAVVGTVDGGSIVTMLGRTSTGSWILVRLATGLEGWVTSAFLTIVQPAGDIPVLADAEPTAMVNTGTLNVRSGPGPNFAVITTVNKYVTVNLVARNADSSWVKIRTNGMLGWVDPSFLLTNANIGALPLATS